MLYMPAYLLHAKAGTLGLLLLKHSLCVIAMRLEGDAHVMQECVAF